MKYLDIMRRSQKTNEEKILAKNLEVLSSVDLEKEMNRIQKTSDQLRELVAELLDVLQLDDSIIHMLQDKDYELSFDDISNLYSIVESFNVKGKFKTLTNGREEIMKEILGEKKYNSKLKRSNKSKLKHSNTLNKKK